MISLVNFGPGLSAPILGFEAELGTKKEDSIFYAPLGKETKATEQSGVQ